MSRFAVVHEDPSYEEPEDIMDWLDEQIDGATVVKKPQEEYSPFDTINSQRLTFEHFGSILLILGLPVNTHRKVLK